MPRPKNTSPADYEALTIGSIFDRSLKLANSAEATAWGMLGGIIGYLVHETLGLKLLSSGICVGIGFATVTAVTYLILPHNRLCTCLFVARRMFMASNINENEYEAMRRECLRRWGLIRD